MLAVLGGQVVAKDENKVEAYDCSQPMNIKMFDRTAHCRFKPRGRRSSRENFNPATREFPDGEWLQVLGNLSP